jgi:hypothetical protein
LVHHFQGLNCRITTLHGRRCRISATRPSGNGASCSCATQGRDGTRSAG